MWHILSVLLVGGLIGYRSRRKYVAVWLVAASLILPAILSIWEPRIRGVGILVVAVGVLVPLCFSALIGASLRSGTPRWNTSARAWALRARARRHGV
jgi:hypothetical protein